MAKVNLNTIKNWFRTGLKPTQNQFWDTWDSFWHKDEVIPITKIENIENILNNKTDALEFAQHLIDEQAHTALFDKKVDKKEGWDLSEENFSPELKEKLENLEQTAQIQIIKVSADDLQTLDQAGVMQWLDSQTDLQIDFSKITCIKVIDGDTDRVFTDEFTDEFN